MKYTLLISLLFFLMYGGYKSFVSSYSHIFCISLFSYLKKNYIMSLLEIDICCHAPTTLLKNSMMSLEFSIWRKPIHQTLYEEIKYKIGKMICGSRTIFKQLIKYLLVLNQTKKNLCKNGHLKPENHHCIITF